MLNIHTSSNDPYVVFGGAFVHMTSINCETFVALLHLVLFFYKNFCSFVPCNNFFCFMDFFVS